ncbi:hypothetical protein GE21DRAFT_8685 [Neurospora crassa]|uniref:Uncharacterized protein n=1 Tax=Neurospora crassa (strain ATCC 24698 / 74-OR23-1A / CBS 708.71 / DSM 1257 / FGSC 987) TaxID=367110 RepID=Q7S6I4_NEUCR|nr:hypothetical protein NCU04719 [Neurospora crassa OR74A]EAA31118.1 hypothetical protein NCU04719 [Neurospora crassa OR74A]KHE83295.1 hypothetical protein GE21DRAFT_8685 [Neurospora crassa]|eukprot:XP_960354.1 hypothetical protein NCU04719 [Neurospora crassa OR74A]
MAGQRTGTRLRPTMPTVRDRCRCFCLRKMRDEPFGVVAPLQTSPVEEDIADREAAALRAGADDLGTLEGRRTRGLVRCLMLISVGVTRMNLRRTNRRHVGGGR